MSEDFDWDEENTVIRPQGETAVYKNDMNATVIRQRDPFGGDEVCIFILPEFLPALIRRLQEHQDENEKGATE